MKKLFVFILYLATAFCAFGQEAVVRGKVTDEAGSPVVGAVVYYAGRTSVSAVTGAKGEYGIQAIKGEELVFNCFGYKEERVKVGVSDRIDIALRSDLLQLEEAIVIGYGTQLRQDFTGSIASVKAEDLEKTASNGVLASLQGQVAGLNITSQSGEPGAGYNIKIRGNNSINAASTPLVVIDGMQMDINSEETAAFTMSNSASDPLAFLNPSDIKSVEVLKDASATSIYGARGANGVILITTKNGNGTDGRTIVTLNAKVGVSQMANDIQMLDGQQWINYRFERGDYNGRDYFGKDTDGDGINDSPMTLADYGKNAINWKDRMLRNAISRDYNVSARGSIGKTKKTYIYSSLGYLGQQGIIVNNMYQRFNAQLKLDHDLDRKVKLGASANYAKTQASGAASSTGGNFNNYGVTQMIFIEKPIESFVDPADQGSEYTSVTSIYDCITAETVRRGYTHRILGNVYLDWKIIPSLALHISATGNVSYSKNNEFYSDKTRWGHSRNGVANYANSSTQSYTASATLTYRKTWVRKHNFDAMIGGELNDYEYEGYSQSAYDFPDNTLKEMSLPSGTLQNPVMGNSSNSRLSAFGRVNYNYLYKYYLTLNLRADGSSKFSSGSRVGYFPSLSAAWRINKEKWMSAAARNWLDNLKIRASAGISGNDRIASYSNLSSLDKVYYAIDGKQITGMAEYTWGNPKLKWESTYQYDLGLDFTAFGGRIDFSFDCYYKDTRDMLFRATIPSQLGFARQWQNIGRVENKGLEFSLKTVNVKAGDFSWSTNITFDLNRNKILSLGKGVSMMPNNVDKGLFKEEPTRLLVGQPIGIIWGYEWDGNYQLSDFDITYKGTGIPVDAEFVTSSNYNDFDYALKEGITRINGTSVKPGDRKFKDLDGDGVIKEATDKKVIGNCYPDFSFSFGHTFQWKGLSMFIFFEGVQGRDLLNEFKARSTSGEGYSTYMYNITKDAYYGAWRPENGSNNHARLGNQLNCQQPVCSYYVEDASYLRLKTLSLSYSLPKSVVRRIRFDSLSLSLVADNVITNTKYSGLDPDISSKDSTFPGLDRLSYPSARTFSLSLNATF